MKKILFLLLAAALFFSCSKSRQEYRSSEKPQKTITITDSRNITVSVPAGVKSIATFPAPHPHIIVYLDGDSRRIRGLHPLAKKAAEASILSKIAPGLLETEDNFLAGSLLNAEELLKINPDVFFTDQLLQGVEKLEEGGIPVIYLGLEKEKIAYRGSEHEVYSPEKSMREWVGVTAEVLETDHEKAFEIFREWSSVSSYIGEKVLDLPDEKRKKVLIVFRTNGNLVAGGNSFGHYWIAKSGGINVAGEITANHPAMVKISDFEQILKWNPDVVYLTNFEETMPDDIYENRIAGQDWSGTNAFINRQVYKIPLGVYRWYPPSLDGPLMLKWMALHTYPEIFSFDIENEIKEYYKKYYRYTLSDSEVERILNPEGSGNF